MVNDIIGVVSLVLAKANNPSKRSLRVLKKIEKSKIPEVQKAILAAKELGVSPDVLLEILEANLLDVTQAEFDTVKTDQLVELMSSHPNQHAMVAAAQKFLNFQLITMDLIYKIFLFCYHLFMRYADGADVPENSKQIVEQSPNDVLSKIDHDLPVLVDRLEKEKAIPKPTNAPAEIAKHEQRFVWLLDPGHGKKTAGKRSPKLPDGGQFFEWHFNRVICEMVCSQLRELGVAHWVVVPDDDIGNALKYRTDRANAYRHKNNLPRIFLSIHANAAPARPGQWCDPSANGIETWHHPTSLIGKYLAAVFQKHIIKKVRADSYQVNDRKLKSAAPGVTPFWVLRKTMMPSILLELGFYNNFKEVKHLQDPEHQMVLASGIVNAIMQVEKEGYPQKVIY